ncbi:hypothetical protein BD309DRAFT_368752 [Dichomitus squalens]|nr:hypothetical protein BD309DRAFT_368752 [Dichomitus squalens]
MYACRVPAAWCVCRCAVKRIIWTEDDTNGQPPDPSRQTRADPLHDGPYGRGACRRRLWRTCHNVKLLRTSSFGICRVLFNSPACLGAPRGSPSRFYACIHSMRDFNDLVSVGALDSNGTCHVDLPGSVSIGGSAPHGNSSEIRPLSETWDISAMHPGFEKGKSRLSRCAPSSPIRRCARRGDRGLATVFRRGATAPRITHACSAANLWEEAESSTSAHWRAQRLAPLQEGEGAARHERSSRS